MADVVKVGFSWKTLRVLEISGELFLFQQEYVLHKLDVGFNEQSRAALESFPSERHRLVPMRGAVSNNSDILDHVDDDTVL